MGEVEVWLSVAAHALCEEVHLLDAAGSGGRRTRRMWSAAAARRSEGDRCQDRGEHDRAPLPAAPAAMNSGAVLYHLVVLILGPKVPAAPCSWPDVRSPRGLRVSSVW